MPRPAAPLGEPPSPVAARRSDSCSSGDNTVFIESAREHADGTVTFPLRRGVSRGRPVWYIVTEASDGDVADRLGVNVAQKLEHVRGTAAAQRVEVRDRVVHFPLTVDFGPVRRVEPGPDGFPPRRRPPGAIGEPGYSPLVTLPDGRSSTRHTLRTGPARRTR